MYSAEPHGAALGAIELAGASAVAAGEGFFTIATHGRAFQLQADDTRDAAAWIASIRAAIA